MSKTTATASVKLTAVAAARKPYAIGFVPTITHRRPAYLVEAQSI